VVSVKTVGVVPCRAVVIPPQPRASSAARCATTALASISTVGTFVGLIASFHWRTPSAATIILIHCAGFALALGWSRLRR
jgi:ABC-type Mn2+/Zn2+ transport system permease subunit